MKDRPEVAFFGFQFIMPTKKVGAVVQTEGRQSTDKTATASNKECHGQESVYYTQSI